MKLIWFVVFGIVAVGLLNFTEEIHAGKEKEWEYDLVKGSNELYIYDVQRKQIEHELLIYSLSAHKLYQFILDKDGQRFLIDERWTSELHRVEEQSKQALASADNILVPKEMQQSHEKWLTWNKAVHSYTIFILEHARKGIIIPAETRSKVLEENKKLEEAYEYEYQKALVLKMEGMLDEKQ